MNLNKFTKAELISKFKKLETNKTDSNQTSIFSSIKTYFLKLISYILLFKNFLIKITLISLIVKYLKRFTILRKLWLLINTIVMSIFGISMLDIYGINILTNLFNEITHVITNITKYLTNTQFYNALSDLFGSKKVESSSKVRPMIFVDRETKELPTESKESSKVSEWLDKINHKQEEVEESNLGYYILCGLVITISACVLYSYWDQVSPYTASIWELIRNIRRRGNNDDNPDGNQVPEVNPIERYNRIVNILDLNRNKGKAKADNYSEKSIELVDETKPYFVEDEDVKVSNLTSPSLESLVSKEQSGWGEKSSSSSSSSSSSTETIKPFYTSSVNDNVTSTSLTEEIIKEKPLIFTDFKKLKSVKQITENNWKDGLTQEVLDDITFIEDTFNDPNELKFETGLKLTDNLASIIVAYNNLTTYYIKNENDLSFNQKVKLKQISFQLRNWLNEHYFKILPKDNQTIVSGDETDSPRVKATDLLEDIE